MDGIGSGRMARTHVTEVSLKGIIIETKEEMKAVASGRESGQGKSDNSRLTFYPRGIES